MDNRISYNTQRFEPVKHFINEGLKVITSICRQPMDTKLSRDCQFSVGVVSLFQIRENTAVREIRGLDHFVHIFVAEANAITRAHVASMGSNMLLGYRINECVIINSSHKNQAQCLLHISGDVALVDHVMSHEGVSGMHMMSSPAQARAN